jgi:phage-related protein
MKETKADKRLPAAFFRSETGNEPVRDWLKDLSRADRVSIGQDIALIEYSWPVGLPTCRSLGKGLWEVRTNLDGRIARVLFCVHDGQMILLHGLIKKTQKLAKADLALAQDRKKKLEKRNA